MNELKKAQLFFGGFAVLLIGVGGTPTIVQLGLASLAIMIGLLGLDPTITKRYTRCLILNIAFITLTIAVYQIVGGSLAFTK